MERARAPRFVGHHCGRQAGALPGKRFEQALRTGRGQGRHILSARLGRRGALDPCEHQAARMGGGFQFVEAAQFDPAGHAPVGSEKDDAASWPFHRFALCGRDREQE